MRSEEEKNESPKECKGKKQNVKLNSNWMGKKRERRRKKEIRNVQQERKKRLKPTLEDWGANSGNFVLNKY